MTLDNGIDLTRIYEAKQQHTKTFHKPVCRNNLDYINTCQDPNLSNIDQINKFSDREHNHPR